MTKAVRWLHISDFHFKEAQLHDRDVVLRSLIKSLPDLFARFGHPDFIIASGDIAYSGKKDEYGSATIFFDELISISRLTRKNIVVIPGNHDVDRSKGKGLERTLNSRNGSEEYFQIGESLIHIEKRQSAFKKWYDDYFAGIRVFPDDTTCLPIIEFCDKSLPVKVFPINTATFCYNDEDSGKLWVGRSCLDRAISGMATEPDALHLTVMHHPLSWLHSEELSNIKSSIRSISDCILTGHLHENDIDKVAGNTGGSIHLSAGAVYQTRNRPNTALMCCAQDGEISVLPIRYEDRPTEVWTVDPSIFPKSNDFIGRFNIERLSAERGSDKIGQKITNSSASDNSNRIKGPTSPDLHKNISEAQSKLDKELFVNSSGEQLYAEPRIMSKRQEFLGYDDEQAVCVSIIDIVSSEKSFLIEARGEHGGSTLCARINLDLIKLGQKVAIKNSRDLPNYKKKLENHFDESVKSEQGKYILILDHFDLERDERLLKELISTGWFYRYIILTVNRGLQPTKILDLDALSLKFDQLFLWTIERSQLRQLAKRLFNTDDETSISGIVDKVYRDLLGLCIPITPANAIMYLRILDREGEFNPLNRVDIVGRYLQELLRKSGDVYTTFSNSRTRMDIVSELANKLYQEEKGFFDDQFWFNFCKNHKDRTLIEFDDSQFLHEIIESRIIVRSGGILFFKYSFFFAYFLGRSIVSRSDRLERFFENEEYLRIEGIIDVITGLNPDNSVVLRHLTEKLNKQIDEFSSKYVDVNFDPLSNAIWPDNQNEQKTLWEPVAAQIEAGPRSTTEIDLIKTSLLEEMKTSDQRIRYHEFLELESALFFMGELVTNALRNSDDVDGSLKLLALDSILKAHLIAFQVGAAFAGVLARRKVFQWGGVVFINFNRGVKDDGPVPAEAVFSVIRNLLYSVSGRFADDLGSHRLAGVLKASILELGEVRSKEIMIFSAILHSKGPRWAETLEKLIRSTDKNSYFHLVMLNLLMRNLKMEISQMKDRDSLKHLVALIQTRRSLGKDSPGSKIVGKMLNQMETKDAFGKPTLKTE